MSVALYNNSELAQAAYADFQGDTTASEANLETMKNALIWQVKPAYRLLQKC